MPADHDTRGPVGSYTAHWPESCLESSVIALDPVVGELSGVVEHFWEEVIDNAQQRCSQISRDLSWPVTAHRCGVGLAIRLLQRVRRAQQIRRLR